MRWRGSRASASAVTLMIGLMMGLGLLLTLSHVALRLSDSVVMHAREERLRGAAIAQALASRARGATGPGGDDVLRLLRREAEKTLDGVRLDVVDGDGRVLHSTVPTRVGQQVSFSRLAFSAARSALSDVSYLGWTTYEATAVLHGESAPEGYLLLGFESDAVARAISEEVTKDLVVGLAWLGVLGLTSIPFVRHLTRPLTRLAADVTELREGSYGGITPVPTAIREVGTLQRRFSSLADVLAEKERENQSLFERLRHQVDVVTRDLEERNAFINAVLNSLRTALITTDNEGRVTSATQRSEAVIGARIELGRPLASLLPEPDRVEAALRRVLEGGPAATVSLRSGANRFLELDLTTFDGSRGEQLGALAKVADVSQARKLEIQVARAERLSSVGEIAAGFAHEFGNSMHVVLGLGKVLLSELPPDAPGRADIAAMVKESEQASALVARFKMFASPSRGKLVPVDLEAIVEDAAQVLDKELRRHQVTFSCHAGPSLPPLSGDAALLRQAFLNLFLNAIQAMPSGGTLTVSLERQDGDVVRVSVSDTGAGISPEDLPRIFDPFFTTKREGEGTGLGLSVVQTVVTLHGGTIGVESEPGRGTRFEITFRDGGSRGG